MYLLNTISIGEYRVRNYSRKSGLFRFCFGSLCKIKLENTVMVSPSGLDLHMTFVCEVKDVVGVVGLCVDDGGNQAVIQPVICLKVVAVHIRGLSLAVPVWPVNLATKTETNSRGADRNGQIRKIALSENRLN